MSRAVQNGKNGKDVAGVIISSNQVKMAGDNILQGAGALHSAINICQLIYELLKF
jgi:hypothetical protein